MNMKKKTPKPGGEPITVLADKQPLTIKSTGFACLVPRSGIRVDVPGFLEVNAHTTISCVQGLKDERYWQHVSTGPLFQDLFKDVFEERTKIPITLQDLKESGFDVQHVAGMIMLSCEAIFASTKENPSRLFYREPETHLHPAEARCLMTMINKLRRMMGQKV